MGRQLRKRIKYTALSIIGFLLAVIFWGVAIAPYRLVKETIIAEIPSLPQSWQGNQVALVSDFQIGMWMDNDQTVEQAIAQIVAERPALTLMAGDFVYKPGTQLTPELDRVIELVRPLTAAKIPTYAVLGNHDYDAQTKAEGQKRAKQIQQALETVGIHVLQNEAIALPAPTQTADQAPLYLIGIGAYLPNQSKPLEAISQVPMDAARIVVMHNPASFAELPTRTAPIAVAGHTHGGQIQIPFTPRWSWMALVENKPSWSWISKIRGDVIRVSGWIPGYGNDGNHLYINRGIGFSVFPIRFNCPPELTRFILRAA